MDGVVLLNENDALWYVCKYCGRAFKQTNGLILHKQNVHAEKFRLDCRKTKNDGALRRSSSKRAKSVSSTHPSDSDCTASSQGGRSSGVGSSVKVSKKNGADSVETSDLSEFSDAASTSTADASSASPQDTAIDIETIFGNQKKAVEWFPQNCLNNGSSDSYIGLLKGVHVDRQQIKGGKVVGREAKTHIAEMEIDLGAKDKVLLQKIRGTLLKDEPQVWELHPFWQLRPENQNRGENILESQFELIPSLSLEAIQLANIDHSLNGELSKHNIHPFPLTFVSSYGHFEEYFLWRHGAATQGFGLFPASSGVSARDNCSPHVCYETYDIYPGKLDESINILEKRTVRNFKDYIRAKAKIDLFIANGVDPNCCSQRSHELVLSQLLLALELLREGGNLIVKVQETISHLARADIFLMSRCFGQISIFNPESCFPGEYYIICRWKRSVKDVSAIKNSLYKCLESSEESRSPPVKKVLKIFDRATNLKQLDEDLSNYITQFNTETAALELDLYKCLQRKTSGALVIQIRRKLLLLWNLSKCQTELKSPKLYFDETDPAKFWWRMCDNEAEAKALLQVKEKSIHEALVEFQSSKSSESTDMWMCAVSSGWKNRFIIMSCGINGDTYKWKNQRWEVIPGLHLPKGTVILAEFCYSGKRRPVLNIIDAMLLDQIHVANLPFENRILRCAEFARRSDNPKSGSYRIMFVKVFPLQLLPRLMLDITASAFKVVLSNDDEMQSYPPPQSISFREFIAREIFLFKTKCILPSSKASTSVVATCDKDFKFSVSNRVYWQWNPDSDLNVVLQSLESRNPKKDFTILADALSKISKSP